MANKPYDWNPFVNHASKIMNEEAGVTSPASAAKDKKPYYVSINGNLTNVNDPEWVARAANTPRDSIQTPGTASATKAKIVKSPIGNVKVIPETKEPWEQKLKIDADTKKYVMKQDYEARKYNKPMSASSAILREIISDDAKAKLAKHKASKPVQIDFSNDSAFRDLEELHQSRIEADARARRYHEIIKKRDDPDLHRGLAGVLGSIPEDFNK
jgi:hypothetical protein